MQARFLLIVALCLGTFAGYYLLRDAVLDPGDANAPAPSGMPG